MSSSGADIAMPGAVAPASREAAAIEKVAKALCEHAGYDPEQLEPGNVIKHPTDDLARWESAEGVHIDILADNGTRPPDGINRKGEKCHFMWRGFIREAQVAVEALK